MIGVIVVDDQAAIRGGFAALIDAQENMHVAGEARNGREAVDLARRVFPDVVLMDIRMPVLNGLQATRLICSDPMLERARVLVLTMFDLTNTYTTRCEQGPPAFCSKTPGARDLLHAIEVIAAGDAMIAPTSPAASSRSSPRAETLQRPPTPLAN